MSSTFLPHNRNQERIIYIELFIINLLVVQNLKTGALVFNLIYTRIYIYIYIYIYMNTLLATHSNRYQEKLMGHFSSRQYGSRDWQSIKL